MSVGITLFSMLCFSSYKQPVQVLKLHTVSYTAVEEGQNVMIFSSCTKHQCGGGFTLSQFYSREGDLDLTSECCDLVRAVARRHLPDNAANYKQTCHSSGPAAARTKETLVNVSV